MANPCAEPTVTSALRSIYLRMASRNPEEEQMRRILERRREAIEELLEHCESPVERILAIALIADGHNAERAMYTAWLKEAIKDASGLGEVPILGNSQIMPLTDRAGEIVFCQFPVRVGNRTFRLDFAIFTYWGEKIAVEVDGHEFHEKTKEQAARDKSRDRELITSGWTVVRFTGSEIWKDPEGCVGQIDRVCSAIRHKSTQRRENR